MEDIPAEVLINETLNINVYDKNNIRNDVLIGKGQHSMKRLAYSTFGKQVDLIIDLVNKDKNLIDKCGKVTITCELRKKEKEIVKNLSSNFKSGLLHIYRISAYNLLNTEWFFGKPDPYIVIKIGTFIDQTPTKNNAETDIIFNSLNIETIVTEAILDNQMIEVEVWEDNSVGAKLVSSGKNNLKKAKVPFNDEIELKIDLRRNNGDRAGRLKIFAKLLEVPLSDDEISLQPISNNFELGTLLIRSISAHNLKDTQSILSNSINHFFEQNLYIHLKLLNCSKKWEDKTPIILNDGINCTWDILDIEIEEITKDILQTGTIEIDVYTKSKVTLSSSSPPTLLGTGKVMIRRAALQQIGIIIPITINLLDPKSKQTIISGNNNNSSNSVNINHSNVGKVVLNVELVKAEEEDKNWKFPNDFKIGMLQITKILATNLKSNEMFGKQDPYIKLNIGDKWNEQTYVNNNGGDNIVWEHLPYEYEISRDEIESLPLSIEVHDKNTLLSDTFIGKGKISLMKNVQKINQFIELKIPIYNNKQLKTGKIIITSKINEISTIIHELPSDFHTGNLKIKNISAFNLKNSEMLGVNKGDPYIKLRIPSSTSSSSSSTSTSLSTYNDKDLLFNIQTKILNNGGENPKWEYLDYETILSSKIIKAGELIAEVWDSNSIHDKLIGFCKFSLNSLIPYVNNHDYHTLTGNLLPSTTTTTTTRSNKSSQSRITIDVQLTPTTIILSKPTLNLPVDFKVGVIEIMKIEVRGLQNKEFLSILGDKQVRRLLFYLLQLLLYFCCFAFACLNYCYNCSLYLYLLLSICML